MECDMCGVSSPDGSQLRWLTLTWLHVHQIAPHVDTEAVSTVLTMLVVTTVTRGDHVRLTRQTRTGATQQSAHQICKGENI